MDELIRADRDRHMRDVVSLGRKEQQVARLDVVIVNLVRPTILGSHIVRNCNTVLRVNVPHKATAVEAVLGIRPSQTVRCASQLQGSAGDDIAINRGGIQASGFAIPALGSGIGDSGSAFDAFDSGTALEASGDRGVFACGAGVGNGCGTAPVDAQPDPRSVPSRTATPIGIRNSRFERLGASRVCRPTGFGISGATFKSFGGCR